MDANGVYDLGDCEEESPVNLRVAAEPYPHLRDDKGCVLARDHVDTAVMKFILLAVEEKIARL